MLSLAATREFIADLKVEKLFLYSLVRLYKPTRLIEIGVSEGGSTCVFAMALRDNGRGQMVSVDNWSRTHGGKSSDAGPAKRRLVAADLERHVKFVTSDSQDFLRAQASGSADIVYVDADHSYEMAKADTLEALRIARRLVIVHDTTYIAEVGRACKDFGCGLFIQPAKGFWLCGRENGS